MSQRWQFSDPSRNGQFRRAWETRSAAVRLKSEKGDNARDRRRERRKADRTETKGK